MLINRYNKHVNRTYTPTASGRGLFDIPSTLLCRRIRIYNKKTIFKKYYENETIFESNNCQKGFFIIINNYINGFKEKLLT